VISGVRGPPPLPTLSGMVLTTPEERTAPHRRFRPLPSGAAEIGDADVARASETARVLLATLDDDGRRWHHTSAVAARAAEAADAVGPERVGLLVAAAWLHDVGYAPAVAHVGFHPVDGAVHLLRTGWPPELAGLVAHHSGARFVARVRGLAPVLSAHHRPEHWCGPVADALTWADQTTSPTGELVTVEERVAEVLERHGAASAQARAQHERVPALLAAAAATERRLVRASALELS